MITSMVSAMRGLISLVVSGCLGGSGAWWEWPWNWFPFQQICLTAILPKALLGMQGIACLNIFLIAREWFAEQELGGETRRVLMLSVHSLGFWAIQSLGLWLVWVQAGVSGRKRLGSWATLLSQDPRPKWIWVHDIVHNLLSIVVETLFNLRYTLKFDSLLIYIWSLLWISYHC